MQKIILTTPDIFCDHCVTTTQDAARKLPGVLAAVTNLDSKQVTVVYEPSQVSLETIEAALEEEGYPVSERTPVPV